MQNEKHSALCILNSEFMEGSNGVYGNDQSAGLEEGVSGLERVFRESVMRGSGEGLAIGKTV